MIIYLTYRSSFSILFFNEIEALAMIDLTNKIFTDETAAREYLEAQRWPEGPVCPHCEAEHQATKLAGKSTRPGVYKCKACEKPYSVTVGTVFERSKIPLHKWLLATFLLCASKKGMSAHQLHRQLDLTYKTSWFMAHRIREAMRSGGLLPPMGGGGGVVEIDETYIGTKTKKARPPDLRSLIRSGDQGDRLTGITPWNPSQKNGRRACVRRPLSFRHAALAPYSTSAQWCARISVSRM